MDEKMVIILIIALLIPLSAISQPQAPDTLWTKTYGGNSQEYCRGLVETADNGYLLVGTTGSFGTPGFNLWLIRTDSNGDSIETQLLDNARGMSIENTADGGYIIGGQTNEYGALSDDYLIMKLDAGENMEWMNVYGRPGTDYLQKVTQTEDGGYIMVGCSEGFGFGEEDIFVVRVDQSGNYLWGKAWGSEVYDIGYSARQTSEGDFVITGCINNKICLIKTDSNGDSLWVRTYGDEIYMNFGREVFETDDGGYIIAASSSSFGASIKSMCLIKTDYDGYLEWVQLYNAGPNRTNEVFGLDKTEDNGYILLGVTKYSDTNYDYYIVKTDQTGEEEWSKILGTEGDDWGRCIKHLEEGGYAFAGSIAPDTYLNSEIWLVRLDSDNVSVNNDNIDDISTYNLISIHPNPFNQQTTITFNLPAAGNIDLSVYDITGRRIKALGNGHWALGKHSVVWDAEGLSSGIYFIQLTVGGGQQSAVRKVVLLK